jgi:large subunit ribosomal protein L35
MGARPDLEHVVGRRHAELLEEDLRHQTVVVLAGVDDRVGGVGQGGTQRPDHGGRLDQVGTGADDVDDPHPGAQYPASASIAGPMPKMKTHSGAKKRFRKTSKGKLRGRRAYSSHILEKKSPKRKRNMRRPVEIAKPDRKRVRTLLGGGS